MKGQRIRYQQTGEFHFLTFSCYRRRPCLAAVAAMELFEDALERVRLRYRFVVAGYEKLRYIHRNPGSPARELCALGWKPARRGLVAKPEDWRWSSYRHYQTGIRGSVEIESAWTAQHRGGRLPEWMRYRQAASSSPVPKSERPGAPSTG